MIPQPKYAKGDKVFDVTTSTAGALHPCPDCLGSRVWPVTSPAGVQMDMDCPRCQRNNYHDGLSLAYTKAVPYVRQLTIGSTRIDTASDDRPVTYMCEETGIGSGSVYDEQRLYATREEADAVCAIEVAAKQADYDARPTAMQRKESSRLGYFTALESAMRQDVRGDVLRQMRSEYEGDLPKGEHTPGVWGFDAGAGDDGVVSWTLRAVTFSDDGGDSTTIATGYGGLCAGWATHGQGAANARLMAASPEMLAVCLSVAETDSEHADAARAAIAKATGESQ